MRPSSRKLCPMRLIGPVEPRGSDSPGVCLRSQPPIFWTPCSSRNQTIRGWLWARTRQPCAAPGGSARSTQLEKVSERGRTHGGARAVVPPVVPPVVPK